MIQVLPMVIFTKDENGIIEINLSEIEEVERASFARNYLHLFVKRTEDIYTYVGSMDLEELVEQFATFTEVKIG